MRKECLGVGSLELLQRLVIVIRQVSRACWNPWRQVLSLRHLQKSIEAHEPESGKRFREWLNNTDRTPQSS